MASVRFAFGPFELDTSQGILFEHGQPVPMGGKALAILRTLLEARGQVVAKSALMDAAWPDTTVEESNLTVQIATLRRQLRGSVDSEDWIATFPRVGYRFAGQFTVVGSKEPNTVPTVEPAQAKQRVHIWPALIGAALLLAFVLGIVGWQQPYGQGGEAASLERMALPLPDRPSIAVLPFINLSKDPEQEFFADGVTEDLITELSKVSGLFVIATFSSFSYKGKATKSAKVAEELGVRYVLLGSVQRSGDRVRINAQLTDALAGRQVWADRFDGSLSDVFALQDKVANATAEALAIRLTPSQAAEIGRKDTTVPAAYDQFLRGWQHYRQTTPADYAKAIHFLEEAVKLDPEYDRAYAALALVYVMSATRQWTSAMGISEIEARTAARRFLSLAQKQPSSLSHQAAGAMFLSRGSFADAYAEFKEAIERDPSDSWSFALASIALTLSGQPEEAMRYINAAIRLDPRPPALFQYYLGAIQFNQEQFDAAAASFERAAALNPNDQHAYLALASAYGYLGRRQDASIAIAQHDALAVQQGGTPATVEKAAYDVNFCFRATPQPVAERLSKGLRLAGAPENLHQGSFVEKNRLAPQDIRSLMFGRRMHGRSLLTGDERAMSLTADGVASLTGDWTLHTHASIAGAAQIKNDELCITIDVAIYCGAVIRNPGGTTARQNEFIWRGYTFSRVK
jgi:TolB-like protein/DNA-binding winged helix-turn-helix (wHTH) protein/Tfp pilus assembly protein PilF